jgi:hypothetical protein
MKKVLTFFLFLGIIFPIQPANAVFGLGECKNLAKRINVGQIEYEKAWDKYQTSRSKTNYSNILDTEVVSRLKYVSSKSDKMLADMAKNPKCLSVPIATLNNYRGIVKKLSKVTLNANLISDPLPEPFEHKKFLK